MITAEGYEGFFGNDNEVLGFPPTFPGRASDDGSGRKSMAKKVCT